MLGEITFEQKYKKNKATIDIKEYVAKYKVVESMVNAVGNIETKGKKMEFINVTIYIEK